jgi:Phage major capsid protein E
MAHMDIFNSDAFSLVNMTGAIEKMPSVPSFLGSLGIFDEEGVDTDSVSIEQKGMTLSLIPTSARGTEPPMGTTDKRTMRNFNIPRVAKSDQVFAREVANIRAFGTQSELETVAQKIVQKQKKLLTEHALTMEYHRLGAIQGILLDTDASTLYNFFTEFGIAAPTEIDFDLDAAGPAEGVLLDKVKAAKRAAIRALGAAYVPGVTQFLWLCGDTFYDQLVKHNDVRVTYKNWEAAAALRGSLGDAFTSFRFGEMDWHNYQGTDDNSTVAIRTGQHHRPSALLAARARSQAQPVGAARDLLVPAAYVHPPRSAALGPQHLMIRKGAAGNRRPFARKTRTEPMATEIQAVTAIIEWDAELGRMAILNPGDKGEVGDKMAAAKIEEGAAKKPGKGKAAAKIEEGADEPAADPEPDAADETTAAADADEAPAG